MLNPNAKLARFTFNLPAEQRYFSPEVNGLRLKLEDGVFVFRPTPANKGHDVIEIAARSRGGRSADLSAEGTSSKHVMQALSKSGFSTARPFFLLHDGRRGWINIEHHASEEPPPKNVPHLRVWPLMSKAKAKERSKRIVAFDMRTWKQARRIVMKAVATVREAEDGRRGPPTRIVLQAKDILASFTNLVGEVAVATTKEPRTKRGVVYSVFADGPAQPNLATEPVATEQTA
jgi:hypothetical protein